MLTLTKNYAVKTGQPRVIYTSIGYGISAISAVNPIAIGTVSPGSNHKVTIITGCVISRMGFVIPSTGK